MKIAQISCKQRHTSVGYTSVAMVTRGSCFSVNSCSCHPIYPPLSLHFPSIWHQGQINKVDKQLKYCSSFWSHCTSVWFFPPSVYAESHATKELSSQCTILQSKWHLQRQWGACMTAVTQTLMSVSAPSKSPNAVTGASPGNHYSRESHFCLWSRHRWQQRGDRTEGLSLFIVKLAQLWLLSALWAEVLYLLGFTIHFLIFRSAGALLSSCGICENVIKWGIMAICHIHLFKSSY